MMREESSRCLSDQDLPHDIEELRNSGGGRHFGVCQDGWVGPMLDAQVFKILAEETLGYSVKIYGWDPDYGYYPEGIHKRIATESDIHVNIEAWYSDIADDVIAEWEIRRASVQALPHRASVWNGLFFPTKRSIERPELMLEHWRALTDPDVLKLFMTDRDIIARRYDEYDPNYWEGGEVQHGIICADADDGCVNGKWYAPNCELQHETRLRHDGTEFNHTWSDNCAVVLADDLWNLPYWMAQLAQNLNLNLSIAYVGYSVNEQASVQQPDWLTLIQEFVEQDILFLTVLYMPHEALRTNALTRITFPQPTEDCWVTTSFTSHRGSGACDYMPKTMVKLVAGDHNGEKPPLKQEHPLAYDLLRRYQLTNEDFNELFLLHDQGNLTDEQVACEFLHRNWPRFRQSIPTIVNVSCDVVTSQFHLNGPALSPYDPYQTERLLTECFREVEPSDSVKATSVAVTSITTVFLLVLSLMYHRLRHERLVRASTPTLMIVVATGGLLALSSAFLIGLNVVTQVACTMRYLLVHLGAIVASCALLAKHYRLQYIHRSRGMQSRALSDAQLLLFVLITVITCAGVLFTWMQLAAPSPDRTYEDDGSYYMTCHCDNACLTFSFALAIFETILVLVLLGLVFLGRNVRREYNEARNVFMTVFVALMCVVVAVPITYMFSTRSSELLAQVLSLCVCVAMTSGVLLLPRIRQTLADRQRRNQQRQRMRAAQELDRKNRLRKEKPQGSTSTDVARQQSRASGETSSHPSQRESLSDSARTDDDCSDSNDAFNSTDATGSTLELEIHRADEHAAVSLNSLDFASTDSIPTRLDSQALLAVVPAGAFCFLSTVILLYIKVLAHRIEEADIRNLDSAVLRISTAKFCRAETETAAVGSTEVRCSNERRSPAQVRNERISELLEPVSGFTTPMQTSPSLQTDEVLIDMDDTFVRHADLDGADVLTADAQSAERLGNAKIELQLARKPSLRSSLLARGRSIPPSRPAATTSNIKPSQRRQNGQRPAAAAAKAKAGTNSKPQQRRITKIATTSRTVIMHEALSWSSSSSSTHQQEQIGIDRFQMSSHCQCPRGISTDAPAGQFQTGDSNEDSDLELLKQSLNFPFLPDSGIVPDFLSIEDTDSSPTPVNEAGAENEFSRVGRNHGGRRSLNESDAKHQGFAAHMHQRTKSTPVVSRTDGSKLEVPRASVGSTRKVLSREGSGVLGVKASPVVLLKKDEHGQLSREHSVALSRSASSSLPD
ncbi:MAG: hypothetical protein MHM6MM_004066 [Cercozoa sp. M6MM]